MKKQWRYLLYGSCFLTILIYGIWARFHLYISIPFPGENMDEYSNTWVGLSLIQLGTPVGNSGLPGYYEYDYRYINADRVFSVGENTAQIISYPWLDHPPLLPLVTGGYSYLKGARNFEDVTVAIARRPMVYLSVLSLILLILFANLLFGPLVALIAGTAYAVSPYIVISGRLIQGENGYLPFYLLTLVLLYLFCQKRGLVWLILASVTAGTATLFKLSALSLIPTAVLLLWLTGGKKVIREMLLFIVVTLSITSLYFVYGLALDPKLLLSVTNFNAERIYGIGPAAFYKLIIQSLLTGRGLEDGWKLTGLISVLVLAGRPKIKGNLAFIIIPFFSHLAIYLLFGSLPYGWYTFPFLPSAMIAFGYLLALALRKANYFLLGLMIVLLPLGVTLEKITTVQSFRTWVPAWRFGFFFLILTWLWGKRGRTLKLVLATLLALAFFTSYLFFSRIDVTSWYSTF